jgi:Tfp pilus assembly protein PilO
MNEQPAPKRPTNNRSLIKTRLETLNISRPNGVLGPAELVALAGSGLILILVVVSYLYFLAPARSRVEILKLERTRLQSQLQNSQAVVLQGQTTEATVQTITQSLDGFESKRLVSSDPGRMGLYDSLNQLIRKNGLRNTSGPTYTPLDPAGQKSGTSGAKSASAKWQSIYPGIAISLTVEGQYQSLRRFVRELETDKQFIIINSVELESATETSSAPLVQGSPAPGARGTLVSLRLELATYFQRGGAESLPFDAVGH